MNLNGNLPKIKSMAKQITLCDGGVNVWYLPYTPSLQHIIIRHLKAHFAEFYETTHSIFAVLDTCIIDCESLDDSNVEAQAIAGYIHGRQGNEPVNNFYLFSQFLTTELIDKLWEGYDETRAKLPQAPEETQEGKPEAGHPKGKRGKKRTKVTS